jgi:hypothetical protein
MRDTKEVAGKASLTFFPQIGRVQTGGIENEHDDEDEHD